MWREYVAGMQLRATEDSTSRVMRRRIGRYAGLSLEKLSHAIEYLADEIAWDGGFMDRTDPRFEAIEILMGLNRKIYLECPAVPTFGERISSLLSKVRRHTMPSPVGAKTRIELCDGRAMQVDGKGAVCQDRPD